MIESIELPFDYLIVTYVLSCKVNEISTLCSYLLIDYFYYSFPMASCAFTKSYVRACTHTRNNNFMP